MGLWRFSSPEQGNNLCRDLQQMASQSNFLLPLCHSLRWSHCWQQTRWHPPFLTDLQHTKMVNSHMAIEGTHTNTSIIMLQQSLPNLLVKYKSNSKPRRTTTRPRWPSSELWLHPPDVATSAGTPPCKCGTSKLHSILKQGHSLKQRVKMCFKVCRVLVTSYICMNGAITWSYWTHKIPNQQQN